MVSSVGSSNVTMPEATVYQRKVVPVISNKVDPGSVSKPRLGKLAPPEMLAQIKQMGEAAKGAQAQYNAMAKQMAALNGPLSAEVIALRQHFGVSQTTTFADNAGADPLSALFVDTKA